MMQIGLAGQGGTAASFRGYGGPHWHLPETQEGKSIGQSPEQASRWPESIAVLLATSDVY